MVGDVVFSVVSAYETVLASPKRVFSVGLRGYFTSFSAQTEEARDHQSGYVTGKDRVLLCKP
jgi:hypothetical protein